MNSPFQETTLTAGVFSRNSKSLIDTCKVLEFCSDQFQFKRVVLFSHEFHPFSYPGEWIQTPRIDSFNNEIFILPMIYHITGGPVMVVRTDGFIVHPELFEDAFLEYDYIGSPCRVPNIGIINNGFCWQSKRFVEAFLKLPGQEPDRPEPSDVWICRSMRGMLEGQGVRFAPTEVCSRFSSEFEPGGRDTFGFHGTSNIKAYTEGWEKINRWLK